jgi:hypothetical protein
MNRVSRFHRFSISCRRLLLTAALIGLVGACGRQQHGPNAPPSSVPRPTTMFISGAYLTTADPRLHAQLKTVPAGWM